MSAEEETYVEEETEEEEEETKLLNAEQVTTIATDFLKRLGNKQMLKPIKASLEEEEIYVVEVALSKKIATVQIDATTEQIVEYEIVAKEQETPSTSFLPLTPQNIMILAGTAIGSVVISALLGLQSLIPSIL